MSVKEEYTYTEKAGTGDQSPPTDLQASRSASDVDEDNTFDVDATELPPGYFKSSFFWGSMVGIGVGLMSGVAGFGFAAPVLGLINNDIGPVSWE